MTSHAVRVQGAPPCAPSYALARREQRVRAQLRRFDPCVRLKLAELAAQHRYIEDLLWSSPAIAHALASRQGGVRADRAQALVVLGAPLRTVARELGLPLWLRRLPPEAFAGNIPTLPPSAEFATRIANHFPKPKTAKRWLRNVSVAYRLADADFAIWLAGQEALAGEKNADGGIAALACSLGFPAEARCRPRNRSSSPLTATRTRGRRSSAVKAGYTGCALSAMRLPTLHICRHVGSSMASSLCRC